MSDVFDNATVQQIIDRLALVPDKTQPFELMMWCDDGDNIDYSAFEIKELVLADGSPASVGLEVKFTGQVFQSFDNEEEEEDTGRIIDYIGSPLTLLPYEEQHRPENQMLVQGVPVNPTLRDNFDMTPNDDREESEISDWWGLPFIRVCSWIDMAESYPTYLERVSSITDTTPMTRKEFESTQEDQRLNWFKSWPTGMRYEVRRLDGGAWDRSTNHGMYGDLQTALEIAKQLLFKCLR